MPINIIEVKKKKTQTFEYIIVDRHAGKVMNIRLVLAISRVLISMELFFSKVSKISEIDR